eukprot:689691-Pleurochrysis_carterae.AAC.1
MNDSRDPRKLQDNAAISIFCSAASRTGSAPSAHLQSRSSLCCAAECSRSTKTYRLPGRGRSDPPADLAVPPVLSDPHIYLPNRMKSSSSSS